MGDIAYVAGYDNEVNCFGDPELGYFCDDEARLSVIDVSDPTPLLELGAAVTPDAEDVAAAGGLTCVASGSSGLRVIDFGPEYDRDTKHVVPALSPWSRLALMAGLLGAGLRVWRGRETASSAA